MNWTYTTHFDIEPHLFLQKKRVLIFEGLDTHAKVYLNGNLLIETNNQFRRYDVELPMDT